jgi:hypothetical protein
MSTCFGCRFLIQGGDGFNGCLQFSDPENGSDNSYPLDDPPKPLYDDCYVEIAAAIAQARANI